MNDPMTWDGLAKVAQMIVTIGGAIFGAWWTVHRRISAVERDAEKSVAAAARRVEEVRSKGAHELAEFKLHVAEKYATHGALKEIEERIVDAITRLGDRLDKIVDRNQGSARRREGAD